MTEGETHIDWIGGGIKVTKALYDYLKFNEDGTFVKTIFDKADFDFIAFIHTRGKYELLKDTSTPYGRYRIKENDKVECNYRLMDKWNMEFELEIITPELLKDKDGREYRFVPVDEEKLKGLPEL